MNDELRFGLVGCGKISEKHAREIIKCGKLVAVCDIDASRADNSANKYNAKAYYSFKELIEKEKNNIDIISICTPNGLHAEQSIEALENGFHVLCEKPLAIHSSDGQKMIEAARQNHKKLFVVKSTRFNRVTIALKNLINNNALGKIYSFQMNCFWNRTDEYYLNDAWRGTLDLDGGVLYTQFSHYLDILSWFFGATKSVSGYRKNMAHLQSIQFEDSGSASIIMQNGILGGVNWSINAYQKNIEVSLAVFAEKGTVKLGGAYLNTVEYETPENLLQLDENIRDNQANDYGFYQGSMSNHDKIYANLIKSLKEENNYIADGIEGLKTVQFIETIYQNSPLVED